MVLLDRFTATIEFQTYQHIREALFNPDLSRTFDTRSFDEGNVREGIVSTAHGALHRARRRVENMQFRPDRLKEYERELFPPILNSLLDRLIDGPSVDLFPVGELLSVVLAARRAGVDCDGESVAELRRLVAYVDDFSQGSAILDARDPDRVRTQVRDALYGFEKEFLSDSLARRRALIERHTRGELDSEDLPHDIVTVLLLHNADPALALDDARLVREVATYLQGGTHTSSQTLINALDLLFPIAREDSPYWQRIIEDRVFAQRCVHETLRLRPTTPRMKRRAEAETTVGGRVIPKDALVILDVATANREQAVFGADADEFNPNRELDVAVPLWGLSFGAGPHQCPGRLVAGGLPAADDTNDDHLFGLIALMLQEVVRRGVRPDPEHPPQPDTRTERFTRWATYPVRFPPKSSSGRR